MAEKTLLKTRAWSQAWDEENCSDGDRGGMPCDTSEDSSYSSLEGRISRLARHHSGAGGTSVAEYKRFAAALTQGYVLATHGSR